MRSFSKAFAGPGQVNCIFILPANYPDLRNNFVCRCQISPAALAVAVAVAQTAEETQMAQCEQLAAPLLTDHTMMVPVNDQQLAHVCHNWRLLADCVGRFVSGHGPPTSGKRLEQFTNDVKAAYRSVNLMCSDPDYKTEYLSHAACIRRLVTQRDLCGAHYGNTVQAATEVPGSQRNLCCEYGRFRACITREAARGCKTTEDSIQLEVFVNNTLDSALQVFQRQCQPLQNLDDLCLKGKRQSRLLGNTDNRRNPDAEQRRLLESKTRHRPDAAVDSRRHLAPGLRHYLDADSRRHVDADPQSRPDVESSSRFNIDARRRLNNKARHRPDDEAQHRFDTQSQRRFDEESRRHHEKSRRLFDEKSRRHLDEESRRRLDEESRRHIDAESRRRHDKESRRHLNDESRRLFDEKSPHRFDEESSRHLDEESRRHLDESRRHLGDESRRRLDAETHRPFNAKRPLLIMDDELDQYRYAVSRRFDSTSQWTDIPGRSFDHPLKWPHNGRRPQKTGGPPGDAAVVREEWRDPIVVYSSVITERDHERPWRAETTTARPGNGEKYWSTKQDRVEALGKNEERRKYRYRDYISPETSEIHKELEHSGFLEGSANTHSETEGDVQRLSKDGMRLNNEEFEIDGQKSHKSQDDRPHSYDERTQVEHSEQYRDQADHPINPADDSPLLSEQYLTIDRAHLNRPEINLHKISPSTLDHQDMSRRDEQPDETDHSLDSTRNKNGLQLGVISAPLDNITTAQQPFSSFTDDHVQTIRDGTNGRLENTGFSYTHQILAKHEQEDETSTNHEQTPNALKYIQIEPENEEDSFSIGADQQSRYEPTLANPMQQQEQQIPLSDLTTPPPTQRTTTAYSGWFRTRMPDARIWSNVQQNDEAYAAPHRSSATLGGRHGSIVAVLMIRLMVILL